ncbi:RHS repeat domain-containing protein [Chryseobacterium sp. BIGb0232]|uniref:RHS repeat domain-containing protein n=1 Tax=Chryseobacterium sp. BIGb0232 TaxID=2940598 RepID=UPI000F474526|nr:RHS repeat domain-containing protein [Chryseobacterium sp. BIGb0232]MCS4300805.1 hypothetical protein [Chryseobacterium sp. BIGb0232]ROS20316.1 hypothetical protein EDF65_1033 [Chryseobacterium nakagawai]
MKKAIICAAILSAHFYSAQEVAKGNPGSGSGIELPNIDPPSPESSFRTQFGNLEANEFKGNPNINIPIHTISDSGLKHTISLKYGKAGVKVNDTPNTLGMNWILDAGGVINRTIYDKADEFGYERLLLSLNDLSHLYSPQGEGDLITYTKGSSEQYDHQPDVFSFSFPGYSGSFYLDANFQPVILTQDNNLKIETIGAFKDNHSFIITTYDGTKYTFGGTGATEKTWVRLNGGLSGDTSFFLTKIENTAGNRIEFSYSEMRSNATILGISEQQSLDTRLVDEGPAGSGTTSSPLLTPYSQSIRTLNITDPKILTQISTGSEKITINYSTDPSEIFQKIGNIVVSSVTSSNTITNRITGTTNVKKIVFDYINNSESDRQKKRFFLEKVKEYVIKNNQETFVQEHRFEYDNPLSLPARLSRTTDYLGYYNGTNNGNTSLPNLNLFGNTYSLFNNGGSYYADKLPRFSYAKLGTLTSITYPTKGRTVFEYEPEQARESVNVKAEHYVAIGNAQPIFNDETLIDYELVEARLPLSYEAISIFDASQVTGSQIQIELKLHSNDSINLGTKGKALFTLVENSTGQVVYTKQIFLSKNYKYIGLTDNLVINSTTYTMKFKILDDFCKECSATALIRYNAKDRWNIIDNGNVRLKKQYDISETGSTNIKRFYYSSYKDINNITKIQPLYKPEFRSYRFDQKTYAPFTDPNSAPPIGDTRVGSLFETIFHSEPQVSMVNFDSLENAGALYSMYDPIYPNVTISYGGDQFEKGGEEKAFSIPAPEYNSYTFRTPTVDGMHTNSLSDLSMISLSAENSLFWNVPLGNLSGKLLSHRVFNNKNGQLYLKNAVRNEYWKNLTGVISSVTGVTLFPLVFIQPGTNVGTYLDNMYITAYRLPSYSFVLNKSISKEYLEDVPLNTADDSLYKKITTGSDYLYNNPDQQLSKSITSFSGAGIKETSYLYAREKGNQKLISASMLGIPLETTVVNKQNSSDSGKIISRNEIKYDNPANLLPSSVISYGLQNNIPSTEIMYERFDTKGNLLQYTTKDGAITVIIWGYNKTQPIAKIENIRLTDIQQSFIDSIVNASDLDAAAGANNDENNLLNAFQTFRANLPGHQVTTYSYDPLIGVRSITPPSGIRETYLYDSANRLEKVVDANGKILKEMKYNYKN